MEESLDARVKALEIRLRQFELGHEKSAKTLTTMRQTFYAATVRRKNSYGRMWRRVIERVKQVEEHLPTLRKLIRLSQSIEKERIIVTLSQDQYNKLMYLLTKEAKNEARHNAGNL